MAKENISPFVVLREYFDNVVSTNMGLYKGDCKICKVKDINIFEHQCWSVIMKDVKERVTKDDIPVPIDGGMDPVSPVDDEGKADD